MKLLHILILCLLASPAIAQDSVAIAEIRSKLKIVKTDTEKVWLYNDLYKAYRDYDSTAAMQAADEGIKLSRKAGFKRGESQLLLNQGIFLNLNGTNDEADRLIRKALAIRKATGDIAGEGYCLRALGNIRYDQNQYKEALPYYHQAIEKFKQANDLTGLAGTYTWVGNVFNEGLQQFDKAVEYFTKSLELCIKLNDSTLISYNYNNLGHANYLARNYESALQYYLKSIAVKKALEDERGLGSAYGNISGVYTDTKQYEKALLYLDSSMSIRNALNDKKGIATLYLNRGNILIMTNRLEEAYSDYNNAIKIGTESGFQQAIIDSYAGLSSYYEKKGNATEALAYFKKYKEASDSLYNSGISEQIADLQVKYETSEKEKLIQQQSFDLARRNYMLAGSLLLLGLGGSLGYSQYRRLRLKKEKQLQQEVMRQQELATRAILEAEEAERHRIARELHDGVGQMMSAAKLNLTVLENDLDFKDENNRTAYDRVKALVDDSCREVRTVSHQMMPNALLKAGLGNAIRDFINKIDTRVLKVELYVDGLGERLDQQTETVLYRVIQECVNNVIKHSGADRLDISLVKDDSGIDVTIEDNGKGFDITKGAEGIGLKNIRHRVAFLQGTLDIDSRIGEGTVIVINVPA